MNRLQEESNRDTIAETRFAGRVILFILILGALWGIHRLIAIDTANDVAALDRVCFDHQAQEVYEKVDGVCERQ